MEHADGDRTHQPLPQAGVHTIAPQRGARWWLWPLVLALVAAVFVLQRPEAEEPGRRARIESGIEVPPPGVESTGVFSKLALAMGQTQPVYGDTFVVLLDQQAIVSKSPAERFRAAVIAAELHWTSDAAMLDADAPPPSGMFGGPGPRISVSRALDQIEAKLDPLSTLHADIAALRSALAGNPPALDPDMVDRHGRTIATIAVTVRDPGAGPHDPASDAGKVRARAVARGWGLVALLCVFACVLIGAALTGTVLLIVVLATGRPRLIDPRRWDRGPAVGGLAPPGGETVWLETFGVFVAGFIALKGVHFALDRIFPATSITPVILGLLLQWVLVLTLLWPLARGVRWADYRRRMGYHPGRGVAREIGSGVLAYIASVPLFICAAIVALVLMLTWRFLMGEQAAPLPENRLIQMVGGPTWLIVLLGTLAVVWAPIVEEGIFRGALYRHLRGAMPALGAAVIVAFFFAVMHGYIIFQLIVIGTLGAVFAVMREWRGSIIPCMTAHALHNATVLAFLTTLVTLAGD